MKLTLLFENLLREADGIDGKDFLVVDIQPEYESGFKYWLNDFIEFINKNYIKFNNLVFYYNGADTVGSMNEQEYVWWWIENGLNERVVETSKFYDKGYAFFRYCMDEGIDDEEIVNLVKSMIHYNINDSRELDEDFWEEFIENYGNHNIRELLEYSDDMINIPELMDDLKQYNNIVICGGGMNECLKEVNIALDVLDKNYQILNKYVF